MDAAPIIKNYIFERGNKFFELSNHLGNVLVTISDKRLSVDVRSNGTIDYYNPDIIMANDYYPFGMVMPGRKFAAASGYRYGFNGKENDNEVKGEGNQQYYERRIYDPRLGRFLSVDPLIRNYSYYSSYQFAGNKPISFIDLDGLEESRPGQPSKIPQLTNVSESTCIGCAEMAKRVHMINQEAKNEQLRAEYTIWKTNFSNIGKPVPANYQQFAQRRVETTVSIGGYLGSNEYKRTKANYDEYGKYLPGLSDFDDLNSFVNAVIDGKVDDAAIFAVGFILPEVSGKTLKGPIHHVFTNKNFIAGQQWSKKFLPMFEKAGYKLDDMINKIEVIGHKGPHPEEYHQAVFKRLNEAVEGLEGDAYKKAFEGTLETLKKEVSKTGTELNKLVTKTK